MNINRIEVGDIVTITVNGRSEHGIVENVSLNISLPWIIKRGGDGQLMYFYCTTISSIALNRKLSSL